MATSDEYARTAHALHWLVQNGHSGLAADQQDLVVAAHARDHVLTNLFYSGLYLVGAADQSVELGSDDMLRHPVRGLAEMLRRVPTTNLDGPGPSDVRLTPPAHPAATAWVAAAEATERAARSVSRARPEHLSLRALTMPAGTATSRGDGPAAAQASPTGAAVAALQGNHLAWSLTADVAALAGAVAALDEGLAAQLQQGAADFGSRSLAAAARRLQSSTRADLALMSQLVLRMSESGPLLPAYDLRVATPRAVGLESVWQVSAALDRAIELLDGAATLTGAQHRAMAGSVAAIANRLSTVMPPDTARALDALASRELVFGAKWMHIAVSAISDGTWQAPTQLEVVGRLLGDAAEGWIQAPPDPELLGYLQRSAQRLPNIVRLAAENLAAGFADEKFVMPSDQDGGRFQPVPKDMSWRVQVETQMTELLSAADDVRALVGPRLPAQLAEPGLLPRASVVLRDTVLRTAPRPSHPAVAPTRIEHRLPGRRAR